MESVLSFEPYSRPKVYTLVIAVQSCFRERRAYPEVNAHPSKNRYRQHRADPSAIAVQCVNSHGKHGYTERNTSDEDGCRLEDANYRSCMPR